ncbi:MAG TPA: hypothetical protein VM689_19220 [Aliidongia sp.]|nr:hypothetical protein [Aliidongia sp.]
MADPRRKRRWRVARRGFGLLFLIGALCVGALACPETAFAYHTSYRQFEVWSDRPIDGAITSIIDDTTRRLQRSELYTPDLQFRVFLCNSTWRLGLYGLFQTGVGGITYPWLTSNIYIRAADIAENRILPPHPGPIADAEHRPLSYFIAHEATHIMQSRAFGRLFALRYPEWLNEGYADYVGKGGDFDLGENLDLLKAGNPALDYARSGLYRGYHLEVAWLLDRQGRSIRSVYADPPSEVGLIEALKRGEGTVPG